MGLVIWMGACAWLSGGPLRFTGARLGVNANVHLDLATKVATVQLSGLPLGGNITGTATLSEEGDPVLDDAFKNALARRGVRVDEVDVDLDLGTCRVVARLPLAQRLSITLLHTYTSS